MTADSGMCANQTTDMSPPFPSPFFQFVLLSPIREEVELFCIDHLVMVDIIANEEALIFDFQTVTTPGPGGKVTGLEAVMQVTKGRV